MKPELSIIIPCYNCQETLEEAVESCFNQGLDNLEIVLVDDGSKDATREVMQTLSQRHKEVKLFFHEKNQGGGATRNTAVRNSQSEIIFCLDSDDVLPDFTMKKMLDFLKEKKADGVGISKSIKFIGKDLSNISIVHEFGYAGEMIPLESLLQRNDVFCPLYSTFMFTKRAFEIAGGYPTEHGFDTQGFAWRFLSHGLVAYTCPDTSYLHRVLFKDSYYIREANGGKTNYNWRDIFFEHSSLFDKDTKIFVKSFDCKDFTKDFFTELVKRENVFDSNYRHIVGRQFVKGELSKEKKKYIKRNSIIGFYIRIKARLKRYIRACEFCYRSVIFVISFAQRVKNLFSEGEKRKEYYHFIEKIKIDKKIIVDIPFGGIGDILAYSTLPRLLKESYDVDFYLSERSFNIMRNKDTYKIFFELNPYFKGVKTEGDFFRLETFEIEKSVYTFLTDFDGENVIEILERQFKVVGSGKPEMYYKPNTLEEYKNVILVDENYITGKKLGWKFKKDAFLNEAKKHQNKGVLIEFVNLTKQDLWKYIDMLYSCKYYVGTSSGGAAISACFEKPFTVLLPYNAIDATAYQFNFRKSQGLYIR